MKSTSYRTTFALDEGTALRLERLAARWKVSKAEVVRRSVEEAEKRLPREDEDPVAMLRAYHGKGGLDGKRAEQWLEEIAEDRKNWRG